jgi:hypothetical protein
MKLPYYSIDSKSVIFERFENEVIAIHLDRGIYYSLNSTAGEVFDLVVAESSEDQIVAVMESHYTGAPGEIREQIVSFLNRLESEDLVRKAESDQAASQPASRNGAPPKPFLAPQLTAHRDMQDLFLLDPVHDVAETGWPERRAADAE